MLAKAMATRSIATGRKVYVPGDPKGEWSVVAQAVGGIAIELGAGSTTRLNPLDEGPRPAAITNHAWAALVATRRRGLLGSLVESALGRPMTTMEHTALDQALRTAAAQPGTTHPAHGRRCPVQPHPARRRGHRPPAGRRRPRSRPRPTRAGLW